MPMMSPPPYFGVNVMAKASVGIISTPSITSPFLATRVGIGGFVAMRSNFTIALSSAMPAVALTGNTRIRVLHWMSGNQGFFVRCPGFNLSGSKVKPSSQEISSVPGESVHR